MKRALYQTKIKIILFYTVDISLIGLCWYYLTTFNIVYRYCRLNWFLGGLLSLLLIFVYNTVLTVLISALRCFGLAICNQYMYNVAIFLQKYC